RIGFDVGVSRSDSTRQIQRDLLFANRTGRPLLALRRYRLGVSIPASLFGRSKPMSETIVAKKTYLTVWASLLVLLAITVGVSFIHLGWLNPVAAVSIAVIKAVIIILYFMHVRYSPKVVWIFVAAGFFWLAILFSLSLADYFT